MSVVVTLQAIQFCFDWIVATVIAVNWCYIFKMSFPQYSETTLGWSIYTLFLLMCLPFLKSVLLHRLESDDKKDSRVTLQGWRYLLSITCGQAVSVAFSGLLALLFPSLSIESSGHVSSSFFLACSLTLCITMAQSYMEWLYHVALPSYSDNGWLKSVLTILLSSSWTTMGYTWNGVWDKELQLIDKYVGMGYSFIFSSTNTIDTSVSRLLPPRTSPALLRLDPTTGQQFQFQPIISHSSSDSVNDALDSLKWDAYKAAVTTLIAVVTLYFMPEPPPVDDRRWLTRRLRLSAQMTTLTVAAFALTDVGYSFGTDLVATYTGSDGLGLAAAYAYAVLLSCIVCTISCVFRFRTRTPFQKWLFLMACYDVSYAWWYVWEESLYDMQGWGLSGIGDKWYSDWVDLLVAILENLAMTVLWVWCVKWVSKFAVRKAREAGSRRDLNLNGGSITDSLRFLAACSGLDIDPEGSVTPRRGGYGADAASGAGADRAQDGGAA